MWNCVLAGMAQPYSSPGSGTHFRRAVHSGGCVIPDPGEMRSVSEPPSASARAFHIKPPRSGPQDAQDQHQKDEHEHDECGRSG
jgi:hypothetical protein